MSDAEPRAQLGAGLDGNQILLRKGIPAEGGIGVEIVVAQPQIDDQEGEFDLVLDVAGRLEGLDAVVINIGIVALGVVDVEELEPVFAVLHAEFDLIDLVELPDHVGLEIGGLVVAVIEFGMIGLGIEFIAVPGPGQIFRLGGAEIVGGVFVDAGVILLLEEREAHIVKKVGLDAVVDHEQGLMGVGAVAQILIRDILETVAVALVSGTGVAVAQGELDRRLELIGELAKEAAAAVVAVGQIAALVVLFARDEIFEIFQDEGTAEAAVEAVFLEPVVAVDAELAGAELDISGLDVAAVAGDDVDDAAEGVAVFRIVGAAEQVEFLDGVVIDLGDHAAEEGVLHIHAVDHKADLIGAAAAQMKRSAHVGDAGLEGEHIGELGDRQAFNLLPPHRRPGAGDVFLDHRLVGDDDHLFHLHRGGNEFGRYRGGQVDHNAHIGDDLALITDKSHLDRYSAGRDVEDDVPAIHIGDGADGAADDLDVGAGQGFSSLGVRDGPRHLAGDPGEEQCGGQQQQKNPNFVHLKNLAGSAERQDAGRGPFRPSARLATTRDESQDVFPAWRY